VVFRYPFDDIFRGTQQAGAAGVVGYEVVAGPVVRRVAEHGAGDGAVLFSVARAGVTAATRPENPLEGDKAIPCKKGDWLIIEPVRKGWLLALLDALEPLNGSFPDVDEDLSPLDDTAL
jgi:hypothetical protein